MIASPLVSWAPSKFHFKSPPGDFPEQTTRVVFSAQKFSEEKSVSLQVSLGTEMVGTEGRTPRHEVWGLGGPLHCG